MNDSIRELAAELKNALTSLYRERLKGVYVYGSYARGEQDRESDVDMLVVLDHVERYAAEVDRTGHVVAALSLKHGVSISRVFISQRDWIERDTPFLANAREEAIAV